MAKEINIQKTSTSDVKKKKKKWVPIFAGKEFNNKEIGETFIEEADLAMNKAVTLNLMNLVGDPKRQNFNVKFKVSSVKNGQAFADITGYQLQVAQRKRLSRKGKDKLEDSHEYTTKDNVVAIIKPVFVTKAMTNKSVHAMIRIESRKIIDNIVKNLDFTQMMREVIDNNIQKEVKSGMKKFYPLNSVMFKAAVRKD